MPYIKQEDRAALESPLYHTDLTAGELTYVLYRLAKGYACFHPSYFGLATVIGCFICAVLEFYRRVVAPYENIKATENGDI